MIDQLKLGIFNKKKYYLTYKMQMTIQFIALKKLIIIYLLQEERLNPRLEFGNLIINSALKKFTLMNLLVLV